MRKSLTSQVVSWSRPVGRVSADVAIAALGRRRVARLGRFISNHARLDLPNHPSSNGELLVQEAAGQLARDGDAILDVGANVGNWSRTMLDQSSLSGKKVRLLLFEPDPSTFELLNAKVDSWADRAAETRDAALSSSTGERNFYSLRPGAGINSLFEENLHGLGGVESQQFCVPTVTVDDLMEGEGIERVALLKVDTEGHDLNVLRGAERGLAARSIVMAQFEYNHRWIFDRQFLRDAFALADRCGLQVGKVTPRGIEIYSEWHPELETFREGNYLMFSPDLVAIPTIRWWGP